MGYLELAAELARATLRQTQPSRTPGPWCADGLEVVNEDGYCVCDCHITADAHLVAAAPDLLQALKDWQNYALSLEVRQNKAIAAIAKAEGR